MNKIRNNMGGFALFEVLFFLLLGVVLIGSAYYVGSNHSKKTKSNTSQSGSSSNNTAQTASQIPSSWKTYQDNSLGIKFSYPNGWKVGRDTSGPEPPVVSEFGDNVKYLGTLDVGLDTSASYFPIMYGNIVSGSSLSFDQITSNAKQEWANSEPFKASRPAQDLNIQGGKGVMINQVTSDYSDLIFYLELNGKDYLLTYREQVVANGGAPAQDYTKYSDDMTKVIKSFEPL